MSQFLAIFRGLTLMDNQAGFYLGFLFGGNRSQKDFWSHAAGEKDF